MEYQIIEGIKCYAPEKAISNEGYPADAFDTLFSIEERHLWFRRQNDVKNLLIDKFLKNKNGIFLEIGCGTGIVLQSISKKFSNLKLLGEEIHLSGIKYAKKRLPNVEFIQLDALKMPFVEEFDAIGAFDVLEHKDDDITVIEQIY